ncbi:FadR/GntR family transcriptional regulator [Corallococcus sp. EGB]|uniref:FadR/GntR family transcriptional regulator n=1 Tax=Corallococcus sp. EGB TaxID=1521117 RepID=UPI001CBECB6E|nr:GntR family transcriptional regulator [Corallococcus sp. EGB]
MGWGGLVAYVEAELERDIALGRLPPCGQFPSEAELARRMKVCRGTMREALRRLAARGLVVQRSGRKTRAVALDESLTLENLGLALHDARSPEARWLLEGYFSLRRQVMVELLVDCCAKAPERDLDALGRLCFRLWDAAKWESGERCAQVEFELLRLAARVAGRPGYVLLVQSLHRAFLGGVARLLPFLEGEALRQWVICATDALRERDTRALQHELPALMRACDERLLNAFAPAPQAPSSPDASCGQAPFLNTSAPVIVRNDTLTPCPRVEEPGFGCLAQADAPTACPLAEGPGLGCPVPAAENTEALGVAPLLHSEAFRVSPDSGARLSSVGGVAPNKPGCERADMDEQGPALGDLLDRPTGSGPPPPKEAFPPVPPSTSPRGQNRMTVNPEGGPPHALPVQWAVRLWRLLAHRLGLPAA